MVVSQKVIGRILFHAVSTNRKPLVYGRLLLPFHERLFPLPVSSVPCNRSNWSLQACMFSVPLPICECYRTVVLSSFGQKSILNGQKMRGYSKWFVSQSVLIIRPFWGKTAQRRTFANFGQSSVTKTLPYIQVGRNGKNGNERANPQLKSSAKIAQ